MRHTQKLFEYIEAIKIEHTLVFEQVLLNVGHAGGTGHSRHTDEAFLCSDGGRVGAVVWVPVRSGAIGDPRLVGRLRVRKASRSGASRPGLFITLATLCRVFRGAERRKVRGQRKYFFFNISSLRAGQSRVELSGLVEVCTLY